jgi:hypothetical protein
MLPPSNVIVVPSSKLVGVMSNEQVYANSDFIIEFRKAQEGELNAQTAAALLRLPHQWMEVMISLYEQGCSDSEVMRELRIKPADFKQLMEDRSASNFAEVVDIGRMLARAWWEKLGRENIMKKSINVAMYNLHMQNRFGWATKSEESRTNVEVAANADELDEKLERMLRRFNAS